MTEQRYHAPPWWRTVLEMRAPTEWMALAASAPFSGRLPSGDGHPVLVVPGFLAPDASTVPMRAMLRKLGYRSHGWGQGVNLGPRARAIAELRWRLHDMADLSTNGVTLIGWSLGGVYATILAKEHPELVRQVITLASPFQMAERDRSRASAIYELLERPFERRLWRQVARKPLEVPATSLFSRLDGVVDWRACVHPDGAGEMTAPCESIEVRGATHFGFGNNPAALYVIADRLSQTADDWRPFAVPRGLRRVLVPADRGTIATAVAGNGSMA